MCGISGFVSKISDPENLLNSMASTLDHRGPDSKGIWFDEYTGVGLAFSRLSILDLSTNGNQPMHSSSGQYSIVFNGEIYNYKELLFDLEAIAPRRLRGSSDTEVLLMTIEQWGLEKALEKISGMFGIALYDKKNKTLSLARDRMGEKPIYYGFAGNDFLFGSELKALKIFPKFKNKINRNSIASLMRYSYIPTPHTIYQDIFKLEPGHYIEFDVNKKLLKKTCYWSTEEIYNKHKANGYHGTPEDAVNDLESILTETLKNQMVADVPLGAFLSGGVDSSTIAALMQLQSTRKINTFSIGFEVANYNEADEAQRVAKHIGTDHFDMHVSENDALNVIPNLPNIYDEPFADSSQIPTYLVSKIAKEKVTVALSGDAGDELFGGYNRYVYMEKYFKSILCIPNPLKNSLSSLIRLLSEDQWDRNVRLFFPGTKLPQIFGNKVLKFADAIYDTKSAKDVHHKMASLSSEPNSIVLDGFEHETIFDEDKDYFKELDTTEKMMGYDLMTYLEGDILTKVDRAAMSVSLETRVPFLDPKVIKFAASLPLEYKIRNKVSKWVLREVLYKHVPKDLIDRPKMGFGVPLSQWINGSLKDWSQSLLNENRISQEGYFDSDIIKKMLHEHNTGKKNHQYVLWNILMFQSWLEFNN